MTEEAVTIVKDMAITVPDFFRLLPRALNDRDHTVSGNRVRVGTADKGVAITVAEAEPRRIALVVIDRCEVTLNFVGYGENERAAFLVRFDRAFQRGGG